MPEFAGKVNLIYIDPPFATGDDFSYTAIVPDDPATEGDQSAVFTKQPSMVEQKAYRDTWGRGLDGYLRWFYETAVVLYELLSVDGSIYIHCDWHVNYYVKCIMDEVFGSDWFINEIVWKRTNVHSHAVQGTTHFARVQDSILLYGKSERRTWHQLYSSHSSDHVEKSYKHIEEGTGRRYSLGDLTVTDGGAKGNPRFELLGVTRYWRYNKAKMEELYLQNRIVQASPGTVPRQKRYLDESLGVEVSTLWTDILPVAAQAEERVGYPTQKPETLLERILKASSNEDDLVLDCFSGSGTTAAVAEKLGRRWITADLGRFAIHTTRKRLLSIPDVRPFVVQNLGKYERQAWQSAEFGDNHEKAALAQARYRHFILDLYGAQPIDGYSWLHGVKAGHMVHVGSVDAPVLVGDIKSIAQEFWKAVGKDSGASVNTVDVLGWDFAFELNEMGKQMAADANIKMSFKRIPREVLEKKAVEQGDIRFFELAALSTAVQLGKVNTVTVRLTDFVVPPDDVPETVQSAITHWSQLIDYWAIDWDYKGDTFHNQWQSYRTKKQPRLQLDAAYTYPAKGAYTVVVKVIDILGNDTTKAVPLEVK